MPKPVYIICSRSGAIDRRTNSVSIFDVIEVLNISRVENPAARPVQLSDLPIVHLIAAWMREDESPDQDFQAQTVVHIPRPGQPENSITVSEVRIRFGRPFHRLTAAAFPLPPFEGPGVLRIESRMRPVDKEGNPVGTGEWMSQQTYILVKDVIPPSQDGAIGQQLPAGPTPPPGPTPSPD